MTFISYRVQKTPLSSRVFLYLLPPRNTSPWFLKCHLFGLICTAPPSHVSSSLIFYNDMHFGFLGERCRGIEVGTFLFFYERTCPIFETFLLHFSRTSLQSLPVFLNPPCYCHDAFNGWPLHELSSSLVFLYVMVTCWTCWIGK